MVTIGFAFDFLVACEMKCFPDKDELIAEKASKYYMGAI